MIYITGVNVKSGVSVSASVSVGMEQAIDKVEFAGFVCKDDKTKLLDKLPNDFAKDSFSLLYRTLDQNGNEIEASTENVKPESGSASLTFISDNVMLVKSEFDDGDIYTINGVEYSSVKIQPGMYVDKGGEVNITAISNKTGGKVVKNFVVESNGYLKSLKLSTPSSVIADGDTNVEIPYVATDSNGNEVTNYEIIARSSNTINLSASEGTLKLYEKNDGTAGIQWSDKSDYVIVNHNNPASDWSLAANHIVYNPFMKADGIADGSDRNVSFTSVVVGGESDNIILSVSDMRRPTSIKDVGLDSNGSNNTIIDGAETKARLFDDISYLDQYGKEVSAATKMAFVNAIAAGQKIGNYTYAVKAETKDSNVLSAGNYTSDISVNAVGKFDKEITTSNVKYSIVAKKDGETTWNEVSKAKSVSYSIVPMALLSNFAIDNAVTKLEVTTDYSEDSNGSAISASAIKESAINGTAGPLATGAEAQVAKVTASYKGITLNVPKKYLTATEDVGTKLGSDFSIATDGAFGCKVVEVKKDKLTWGDLYDFNTAKNTRKDASKKLEIAVKDKNGSTLATVSRRITVSDASATPTTIAFERGYAGVETDILNPDLTKIPLGFFRHGQVESEASSCGTTHARWKWSANNELMVNVYDQYGRVMDAAKYPVTYTISDIVEKTGEFTHVNGNFKVNQNGSKDASIEGAEIGDTFTLTATVEGTNLSDTLKVTVGADKSASILSNTATDKTADHALRAELGYDR